MHTCFYQIYDWNAVKKRRNCRQKETFTTIQKLWTHKKFNETKVIFETWYNCVTYTSGGVDDLKDVL